MQIKKGLGISVIVALMMAALAVMWLFRLQDETAGVEAGVVEFKKGNYAIAVRQLTPYAERGNKTAQLTLGMMYAFGNGVARDRQIAAKLLGESDVETSEMFLWIAKSFETGDGVAKDENEAKAWYRLASESEGKSEKESR